VIEITTFRKTDESVLVEYKTTDGDYRIKTEEEPHFDLSQAIRRLQPILVRCMALEPLSGHVRADGFVAGTDEVGNWFQIIGTYTAFLVAHKIKAPKIREVKDPAYWEKKDIDKLPAFFTEEEQQAMYKAIEEAEAFINGKRGQLALEETVDEEEAVDLDELPF